MVVKEFSSELTRFNYLKMVKCMYYHPDSSAYLPYIDVKLETKQIISAWSRPGEDGKPVNIYEMSDDDILNFYWEGVEAFEQWINENQSGE